MDRVSELRRDAVLSDARARGIVTQRDASRLALVADLVSHTLRRDLNATTAMAEQMAANYRAALDDINILHFTCRQAFARIEELEDQLRHEEQASHDRLDRILILEHSIAHCYHHGLTRPSIRRRLHFDSPTSVASPPTEVLDLLSDSDTETVILTQDNILYAEDNE